jgi:hypothetical protein
MADPIATVTTPVAKAVADAAASAVVKNVKADVKAEGVSRPWVLVACSFAAGAAALFLAQHFLHLF